jgi:hypothetical protein
VLLEGFALEHSERAWHRLRSGDVPESLKGPGVIDRRQTTYWDLKATSGSRYRVHFRKKAETSFAANVYSDVELTDDHPLLVDYESPWRHVFFNGSTKNPGAVCTKLANAINEKTAGWRELDHYAGGKAHVQAVLAGGYGALIHAPLPVCQAVAAVLRAENIRASIPAGGSAQAGKKVLLLERSYVIAGEFAFEQLAPDAS